jgi:glycosyltransferase involved in cell wall biosynthesis
MAKIIFITTGFPPYEFSENITNGKLVLALINRGHIVHVISRIDEGDLYNSEWREPWLSLKGITFTVTYPKGNFIRRLYEISRNTLSFKYPVEGIRWAEYAYRRAKMMLSEYKYDLVITRSPSDIPHLVGLRLKKNFGIKWLANWNDPASGIWPVPYENSLPQWKKIISRKFAREALSYSDITTFPSELLYEHFRSHFLIEDKRVKIVPHIMLKSEFSTSRYSNEIYNLHLLFSGNMSVERNPEYLLSSIQKFNLNNKGKIYLDILGICSAQALQLIVKYDLTEYVKVLNPLPYKEAMGIMSQYDVLLNLEARMERSIFLPSKIADYACLNKVILSLSPGVSETGHLLRKYNAGIVADNASIQDIYDKLSFLSRMKIQKRINEIIETTSINEYLGEKHVIDLIEEVI